MKKFAMLVTLVLIIYSMVITMILTSSFSEYAIVFAIMGMLSILAFIALIIFMDIIFKKLDIEEMESDVREQANIIKDVQKFAVNYYAKHLNLTPKELMDLYYENKTN